MTTMDKSTPIFDQLARISDDMKRAVGPIIRENRERKGLSQEALGIALGVSRQAVSMWESATNLPDAARLVVMAQFLDAPELASFAPTWHRSFADGTASTPEAVVREIPFFTTKLVPGSPDQFLVDHSNLRFADTPPGFVTSRFNVSCLLVSTTTMMPWRFPSDAVYFHKFKPPRADNHVILQLRATPPDGHAVVGHAYRDWARSNAPHLLKKLVSFTDEDVRVKQYTPEAEIVIPRSEILSVTTVIEREDLYGPFLNIFS